MGKNEKGGRGERDRGTSIRTYVRTAKGQEKTSRGQTLSLSLSLSLSPTRSLSSSLSRNACNPYYEHPGTG
jgi:hypothetical protein